MKTSKTKKKLGKREMRVAIAKDVLKQLKTKKYNARSIYFSASSVHLSSQYSMTGPELQAGLNSIGYCEVCAIGAALVSGICLFDGVSGSNFDYNAGVDSLAAQKFFNKHELVIMESLYEIYSVHDWPGGALIDAQLISQKERMKCVFRSIIHKKGRVSRDDIFYRFKKAAQRKRKK